MLKHGSKALFLHVQFVDNDLQTSITLHNLSKLCFESNTCYIIIKKLEQSGSLKNLLFHKKQSLFIFTTSSHCLEPSHFLWIPEPKSGNWPACIFSKFPDPGSYY